MGIKNNKNFKKFTWKADQGSPSQLKTKKTQSNNSASKQNIKRDIIGQNLKTQAMNKPKPSLQKENILVATLLANKGKSHKSFHKACEKNYSSHISNNNINEIKPPLKFGLSNNIKNLIKKNEIKI